MSKHRTVSGKIRYISNKPGMEGKQRGFETFTFTHHGDGTVVMRAHCEIDEPAPTVMRDIIYHIGPDMVPLHLNVNLMLGDEFLGSGWMRHDPEAGSVECESYGPSIGRNSEKRENVGAFDAFGTHPVVGDGYLSHAMDTSKGPHRRNMRVFLPSPDHRGATPPQIAEVNIALEYVGPETKTVEAGTFECNRFRFVDDSEEGMGGEKHPDYDIWITADDDAILVYGSIDGYMMNRYELVEFER